MLPQEAQAKQALSGGGTGKAKTPFSPAEVSFIHLRLISKVIIVGQLNESLVSPLK